MNAPRRINEDEARLAFEYAMGSHRQEFGHFFLARLFGMDISYPGDTCLVRLTPRDFMFNPQGSLHGGVIEQVAHRDEDPVREGRVARALAPSHISRSA